MSALDLYVRADEQCALLTRDFFVFQRRRGHRYSVDDLLVAHLAATIHTSARNVLDLGCGIGSVMLMVGWALPEALLTGIEAQQESFDLAHRNLLLNDCAHRVSLLRADLRDQQALSQLGKFDLVTGTPPYFDPKAATPCADPQRAQAKFELRGGIEDYAKAAASLLTPQGLFVVCAAVDPPGRCHRAIAQAGLFLHSVRMVLPRRDRPAFLELLVAATHPTDLRVEPPLVLRELDGRRSEEHALIRTWFGASASER